jgi:carbamoyltransferase
VRPLAGRSSDRLGGDVDGSAAAAELARHPELDVIGSASGAADTVAALLADGQIVARCAGRSEFGPRALGGRSLLASPLDAAAKDRLNAIKHRQPWRPVAPIVTAEAFDEVFEGPANSPYMTYGHRVRPAFAARLPALAHADGTTRAQTLTRDDDPALHDLLEAFGTRTGLPVLVNTSLNGPHEPIVETAGEAIAFFLSEPDIDVLLLGDALVRRAPAHRPTRLVLGPRVVLGVVGSEGSHRAVLGRDGRTVPLSDAALLALLGDEPLDDAPPQTAQELLAAHRRGLLQPAEEHGRR